MVDDNSFVETWRTQNLIDYVLNDLEKRVKKDKAVKLSVFFTGLSAYLKEPINLFLKGESGSGKTYNVTETLKYFPPEDIWLLGGLSPKALIHDYGTLLNKNGEPLDLTDKPLKPKKRSYKTEEEYNEAYQQYKEELKAYSEEIRNSYTLIDLSHKILVFLEAPEYSTFRMLYPILSHDTRRIEYKFTDKTGKGQLRTSRVIIEGWPATIFCMVDKKYMEELSTRSFTVTPEASKEKIEEANKLTNLKASLPWNYNHATEEYETIRRLIESIQNQLNEGLTDVVIPFMNLNEFFPKEIVRDMRDFQHFTQFLKTITVLHFYQRPFMKIGEKKFLLSTVEDVREALEVYNEVFETTRTGTEQRILDFYHEIVKTKEMWYLKELTAKYNESHRKKLSSDSIKKRMQRLSEIGYVDIQKNDEDKRLNIYKPLIMEEEKREITGLLETPVLLNSKLKEGFKDWLNKCGKNTQFYYYKNFAEKIPVKNKPSVFKEIKAWGEYEINIEDISKIVLMEPKGFPNNTTKENFSFTFNKGKFPHLIKEDSQSKIEKKLEITGELKTPVFSRNSENHKETMIQCPFCASYGKQLFFSNQHDLDLHFRRFHSGYPDSKIDYVRR